MEELLRKCLKHPESQFDRNELEKVQQTPFRPEIVEPPSKDELEKAIRKLKYAKGGGSSNILPTGCEDDFLDT